MSKRSENKHVEQDGSLSSEYNEKMADRQKERSLVQKIVWSIILILVILLIVFGISGYRYITSSLEPMDPTSQEEVEVEIPFGSSSTTIARILEENEIIRSASVFRAYIKMNNETNFQSGSYVLSPSMTLDEIIGSLQEGGSVTEFAEMDTFLIPEGITLEQMAGIVDLKTVYTAEEFMTLVEDEAFLAEMQQKYPELLTGAMEAENTRYVLEGYLFPATYEYAEDSSLETIIENMIKKMNDVMLNYYGTIEEQGSTVHEVLTLASLVEKEGSEYEDRTMIASVFYNRLEDGMMLQTDVAVFYALEEYKERVSNEDTEFDSPYNLYKYAGLGPGPFNNPSEDAIKATLNPADTDYYYFLADLNSREVYFSQTYEQHLKYKAQYLD